MAAMPFKHNVRPTLQVSCNPRTRLDICGAVALGVAEPSLDLHNAHNIGRRRGTGLCLARDIDLQLGRPAPVASTAAAAREACAPGFEESRVEERGRRGDAGPPPSGPARSPPPTYRSHTSLPNAQLATLFVSLKEPHYPRPGDHSPRVTHARL